MYRVFIRVLLLSVNILIENDNECWSAVVGDWTNWPLGWWAPAFVIYFSGWLPKRISYTPGNMALLKIRYFSIDSLWTQYFLTWLKRAGHHQRLRGPVSVSQRGLEIRKLPPSRSNHPGLIVWRCKKVSVRVHIPPKPAFEATTNGAHVPPTIVRTFMKRWTYKYTVTNLKSTGNDFMNKLMGGVGSTSKKEVTSSIGLAP